MATLAIGDSWEISLREVSALGTRGGDARSPMELLAVADERWAVVTLTFDPAGAASQSTHEVAAAIAAAGLPTDAGSGFEGVTADGGGRVFVLQEGPARVFVFDPAMAVLQHTITLKVTPDTPDIGAAWTAQPNARGEGLVLLDAGHLLVAQQRNPVRLVEFGPAGDPPLGYAAGRSLAADELFVLPDSQASEVEVLATWALDPAAAIESINDLAVDGDGGLHFVSSRSRCIGRVEGDLIPGQKVVPASVLPLPAEMFAFADDRVEGLIITDDLGRLVALDLQRPAANLHQVKPIPG